jgi:cysteine desulfurase family protein (TIGR01976 family)
VIQTAPSIEAIRAQFPSLTGDFAFLENAGGSQVPGVVIDEISRFYREDYAQKGASYGASVRCGELTEKCKLFMARIFGGEATGQVAVGQSATALFNMLAGCYRQVLKPGDEIVISVSNHESHVGCWERLNEFGVVIKWWGVDPVSGLSSLDDLAAVVSERTKLICFTQTCNLVGDIVDPKAVVKIAESVGAVTVLDAVASASHQALSVEEWGVDFCCFSAYKVYGPHMGALWGKNDRWAELNGPNHKQLPMKGAVNFELGCLSYEGMAGFLALGRYFGFLAGAEVGFGEVASRDMIMRAYSVMGDLERGLSVAMLGWLNSRSDLRVLGVTDPRGDRHPTFSFVHDRIGSDEIERRVNQQNIGIKYGHMYAWRVCEAVGIPVEPGVVRVSAVHYNSVEEIQRVCGVLESVLNE